MGKFLVENSVSDTTHNTKDNSIGNQNTKIHTQDDLHLDSYYGPDVPPNILFPDQLNKYLKDQLHNLTLENGSLRRTLEEMQDELSVTKQKLSKPSIPLAGRASEVAANKIAELSKKLREQNAELESLKTRAKDAEARLRMYENNASSQETVVPPPSEDEHMEKERQIKCLHEKLQCANNKMCDFRNQCQALKQELKLAQKVIENEVGEKVSWQDLAKENGNWRGRAQQIISLQNKVQHLQEQLSNSTTTESPAANVLRQMEKDRRASYEETAKQLNVKTIQLEEMRKKLEASKARNKVLENEIIQVKTKLCSVMEKGIKDEQLLTSLTNQINVYEDRGKAQTQCFTKLQDTIHKLQQEIDLEKEKNEKLHKALGERENRIQRLEEQIEELRKIKNLNREVSPEVHKEAESGKRTPEESDNKIIFSVIDSERMRLLELLAVVNRRLDESRREGMEMESQLKKEKFKNAKLETKIARLEMEKVGVMKPGRGSYSQTNVKVNDPSANESDIMARHLIEYLQEECLALKTRIETLQMEKEDDLKVFAAMTDMRDSLLEPAKPMSRPSRKKLNSPTEKRSLSKLPGRRAKHSVNRSRKSLPSRRSTTGNSSYSSEESIVQ